MLVRFGGSSKNADNIWMEIHTIKSLVRISGVARGHPPAPGIKVFPLRSKMLFPVLKIFKNILFFNKKDIFWGEVCLRH